jgi:membrane protein DedA with SNARE-associated domain
MTERSESLLAWLASIPEWWLYLLVGAVAAVENLVPPFPSDVVVVIGGVAAGAGRADPWILFVAAWLCNAGSALLVYGLGRRYGAAFFGGRAGRFLLAPAQVDALAAAYRRFGFPIIFFSRFLPVFRPIVPVFAGVARLGFWGTALPIALASAVWYGLLVYLGALAGANWRSLLDFVERLGWWLWIVAGILIMGFAWWWRRTRRIEVDPNTGRPS